MSHDAGTAPSGGPHASLLCADVIGVPSASTKESVSLESQSRAGNTHTELYDQEISFLTRPCFVNGLLPAGTCSLIF